MSLEGKLEFWSVTDVGRQRSHNEDCIGSDSRLGVAILADGMGGYQAGEVASAIAVEVILDRLQSGLIRLKDGGIDEHSGFSLESVLVKEAIEHANHTIYTKAQAEPQCQGMGTTLVVVAFYDNRMTIAHVGDSRAYRMREDHLEQLTSDHSLLQELVNRGFYTEEEAKQSLNKNLLTRAIGIETTVTPDVQEDMVKPGDIYLLCSDGLSDLVDDDTIHATLSAHRDNLEKAARVMVQKANDSGGKDNISVVLA
ncbi:MAG: Stp1/IreP family PP2C-type Ser/Thr phosphatase, partial [Gammaproteobacteria bacterium]